MVIQSFVLSRCGSMSSGFPEKSGLNETNLNDVGFAIGTGGFLAKDLDYLVHLVLLVLQLECLGVDLVVLAPQLEIYRSDLGENVGKSTSPNDSSESELITIAVLPSFSWSHLYFYLLPVLYVQTLLLGFAALDAIGICVGKCTDLDLILGLPALDVDAMGLSAIRHSTICQILSLIPSKNKIIPLFHIFHR